MNKVEFLNALKADLRGLSEADIADIVRDQEEYIMDAMSAGRSEQVAVDSLGDPHVLASTLRAQMRITNAESSTALHKKAKNTINAVLAVIALAPLNILFILFPFLFFVLAIFVGWTVVGSIFLSTVAVFGTFLFKLIFVPVGILTHLSAFFLILGLVGLGILGILTMYKVSELVVRFTIEYLKWNINFVKKA